MSERDSYPAGVPCWVETLQPDPQAAVDFYAAVFGWDFAGPAAMPGDPPGDYYVARLRGRDVAGIGALTAGSTSIAAAWHTLVRVDDVSASVAAASAAGATPVAGPLDAPPAGRLAAFIDPTGAALGVWEAGSREGAQLLNEASAWAMSRLHTTDLAAAAAFYQEVFGWQAEPFGDDVSLLLARLPGYVGGEPQQPVPRDVVAVMSTLDESIASERASHWAVDFWVADADAAAAQAIESGGGVLAAPTDVPGFRTAVLVDPAGAAFSVSQLAMVDD